MTASTGGGWRSLATRARTRLGRGGARFDDLRRSQEEVADALARLQAYLEALDERTTRIQSIVIDLAAAEGLVDDRNRDYDAWTAEIISRTLGPGSTAVDVGAHTGSVFRLMLAAAPGGRHYAFEPIPELAAGLRAAHPDAEVHQLALSDASGTTSFHHVTSNPSFSGIRARDYTGPEQVELIEVPMARLDDVVPAEVPVHLLKVDVEGGELGVLRGASRILDAHHPVVVFECGPGASNHYGTTPADVHALFAGHGMAVGLLDGYLRGDPGLTAEELAHHYDAQLSFCFVAYPDRPV